MQGPVGRPMREPKPASLDRAQTRHRASTSTNNFDRARPAQSAGSCVGSIESDPTAAGRVLAVTTRFRPRRLAV